MFFFLLANHNLSLFFCLGVPYDIIKLDYFVLVFRQSQDLLFFFRKSTKGEKVLSVRNLTTSPPTRWRQKHRSSASEFRVTPHPFPVRRTGRRKGREEKKKAPLGSAAANICVCLVDQFITELFIASQPKQLLSSAICCCKQQHRRVSNLAATSL